MILILKVGNSGHTDDELSFNRHIDLDVSIKSKKYWNAKSDAFWDQQKINLEILS